MRKFPPICDHRETHPDPDLPPRLDEPIFAEAWEDLKKAVFEAFRIPQLTDALRRFLEWIGRKCE